MWSLGKVINTPEVVRVYVGSFWDQLRQDSENYPLLVAEQADLLRDLRDLPRNAAIRKVNELVKRARMAKVYPGVHSFSSITSTGARLHYWAFEKGDAVSVREGEQASSIG
jgi:hypothetical protein